MKVALIFDVKIRYPPDYNNMKCYYVTRELCSRGIKVTWLSISDRHRSYEVDGIKFVELQIPKLRFIWTLLSAFRVATYCRKEGISVVYADDWLFMRKRILSKLSFQFVIRLFRIFWTSDMRDPWLDFEVAIGNTSEGSIYYLVKRVEELLFFFFSSLIILPSEAYASFMIRQGIESKKVFGIFRGIDRLLFTPYTDGRKLRERLRISDVFVLGWFGIMHRYRLIDDVLIPLANNLEKVFPDAYLLIGGKGPMQESINKLNSGTAKKRVIYVGTIPYENMPEYIAACDLLLCPVSTKSRFSLFSAWLKIAEALAVGKPVVATRTFTSTIDFKQLRGVVWVGSTYEEFIEGIKLAMRNLPRLREEAMNQAADFRLYSIDRNISKIVDAILNIANSRRNS